MKRPLTIGYITVDDPRDRRTWSGINSFLLDALEARVERVVTFGPLRPQPVLFFCKAFNYITLRLLGKRFHYRDSFPMARAYARMLEKKMAHEHIDLIVAPAGLATTALLKTNVPIVYINDRSIAGALEYYKVLKKLFRFSRKQSLALERKALENAALAIYSSDWAAKAAVMTSPANADKVHVIPLGANLVEVPAAPAHREFPQKKLKMLFLGVYWTEKGGPIAYQALQEVKRRGILAELVVCGCVPPEECNDPDLVREGFLNKNIPADLVKFTEHLRTADLLILPTRFEAFGIVFCEAAAYGLPVLATRTGGVPTAVEEGRTGYLFDPNDDGVAYAERILELHAHPEQWQAMRIAARQRYEQLLNWDAFADRLLAYVDELPSRRAR
ncbi:MAG: glycosyltransferase family 4 protein [Flavobacteriales bacterium]|nr:glycosyltransferase family 4 protein [Flavobacteriales bacterium]